MGIPCLICHGEPREVSGVGLGLLVTEELLRSPPRAEGAATQSGSGSAARGCVYSRGNRELALSAGRFKLS